MAFVQTAATPKENKETITLIWFDPNITECEDIRKTQEKLRKINDYVIFYTDLHLCVSYIQSSEKEKIFLVTSGEHASHILPQTAKLRQIDSIFMFCTEVERYKQLADEYPKKIAIYNTVSELCESIQEQTALVDNQLQTLSSFDQYQQSTKDLTKQSEEFLWFQLFKYIVLRLPRNEQAKHDMIDTCRRYYTGNTTILKSVDQFERDYRSENAVLWYTKDSFVYRLVNKALRTEDMDQLYKFRFFISDLSEILAREHEKLLSSMEEKIVVYRGAKLDKEEFDKLKQNQGKLISTNGYLSTSRNRALAVLFAEKSNQHNVVSVLFEIHCDIQELSRSVIFADIAHMSQINSEEELLFDLDATFRVESIENDEDIQLIKMTATKEAATIIGCRIEKIKQEIREKSVTIVFGELMRNLGEYEKSQEYFEQLLREPNGDDLAWIQYNIGAAVHFIAGDCAAAREYYDRAYEIMINTSPQRLKDLAAILSNTGNICYHHAELSAALEYYQRTLQIQEKLYPFGHVDIANNLQNISFILSRQREYQKALKYRQQALQMQEKLYPYGHVDIVQNLRNIGVLYAYIKQNNAALDYYKRASVMCEKLLPSEHPFRIQIENDICEASTN